MSMDLFFKIILLYGMGSRNQAEAGYFIVPVINRQQALKIV